MISKVTLTKVYISEKSKENVPFITKDGKPYKKIGLMTTEHGEKWLSGFVNKDNENWKEGDQVDIIIEKNGEYLNFKTPKAEDKLASRISALEVQVMNLQNTVSRLTKTAGVNPASEPTPEILNEVLGTKEEYPDF